MATTADTLFDTEPARRSAGPLSRWIYVFMAAWFIAIALAGFVPSMLGKLAAIQAGARPPFPPILKVHAALMGSFLLLLLAQTILVATGGRGRHQWLGKAATVIVPAMVVVWIILVPADYHAFWNAAQAAPQAVQERLQQLILRLDDILLLQLRITLLFPLLILIAWRARRTDLALHKRLMILATVIPLQAGIDRLHWLPTTHPASPLSTDVYTLLAIAPIFIWDVLRNRSVARAYLIWMAAYLLASIPVYYLWGSQWWHSVVPRLMRV